MAKIAPLHCADRRKIMDEVTLNARAFLGKYVVIICALVALRGIISLVFFAGHWLNSQKMGKETAEFWDITFKGVAGFVAIFGAWLALIKYFHEKTEANKAALKEARKPFATKRQEIYSRLLASTSGISTYGKGTPEYEAAEREFWLLYWVEVPLVIDNEVATAINEFEDAVWKYQKSEEEIRNYGMKLANSCRKSLGFVDEPDFSLRDTK